MLLDCRITVGQRLIGELPLNPDQQDFIQGVELELEAHAKVSGIANDQGIQNAAALIVSPEVRLPRTVL
jgi:hypothetical protein